MGYSVGNAIRDINKNGMKPSYFLLGDDFFMQNFFINKVKENLIKDSTLNSKYFHLNEENDLNNFFNDITSLSLFSSKDLFIIKNFNKMSKQYQSTLTTYMQKISADNIIIFVLNDFIIKNKFVKEISEKSVVIDTRTPINKRKIMNWVTYYYNNKGISIDNSLLKYFVDNYSDDISTVINEIEKHFLYNNDKHIDFNLNENNIYFSKHIKAWNLLDALGRKDVCKSISYYNNLYINGISLVFLLINLNNFYFELYNAFSNKKNNYNPLNKILQSNLNLYKNNYSKDEVVKILLLCRDLDVKIKTSTFDELTVFSSIIIKICNRYYD